MGNDILDKILSDAASVAKRRKEETISVGRLGGLLSDYYKVFICINIIIV